MTAFTFLNIDKILAPIADDMEQVNNVIYQSLTSDVLLINQIIKYIISSGGKRLRPALLLLISSALGETSKQRHVLSAIIEFIHTATLLHDDVIDESSLRRGRKTVNIMLGNAVSVLVGDYLYSRSFEMIIREGKSKIMEIMSEATTIISEGEVLQLLNINNADINEADYIHVIRYKTAKLFEVSAHLGAVLAGADSSIEAASVEYGRRIGTAFQIMDDWLDFAGNKELMGKNAGDDLREGKATLPLIYLINYGTPEQVQLAREAIEQNKKEHGKTNRFDTIFNAIIQSGALDHTLECARKEAIAAASAIVEFPDSIFKESLLELCEYSTSRQS
ncbi:MAG: polyprenyl synthetase family protein [Burkholderia sp.]|nr:polyprenyl synthetase family protein [Burkholderia sp.]